MLGTEVWERELVGVVGPALPVDLGLGERIRAERLKAGLTQQELGAPACAAG